MIRTISLSKNEERQVAGILTECMGGEHHVPVLRLLDEASLWAHELPRSVRRAFQRMRLHEEYLGLLVTGHPLGPTANTPTPTRLRGPGEVEYADFMDVLHVLYACLLGDPFGWTSIQCGYILNDIVPVKEHESRPMSSGSQHLFDMHTEDAFHDCAGDYLGLLCRRNLDSVPTLASFVRSSDLSTRATEVLFEPRFQIKANLAHRVRSSNRKTSLLFGHKDEPYLRINLNSMEDLSADPEASAAVQELEASLRKNSFAIQTSAGDYLYLDNYRATHGRSAYTPRYDGSDRWLRRLYITSALRKSRHLRSTASERVICPEQFEENCIA